MSRARETALGTISVVASGLCFGSMPVFARAAYASGVDPPTLLLLRFTVAAAVLWAVLLARGARLPRGRWLAVLAAMGGLGYAGQSFFYFTALTMASAGVVTLVLYLYPALVALLSRLVLGHALSPLQVAAVATALVGSVLTVGRAGDATPLGILLAALAATTYAVYILTGSRIPAEVTPTASSTAIITGAAISYAALGAVRGVRLPGTPGGWGAALAIALVCTVLAIFLFQAGLQRLGAVRASVYSTVEPAFTLLLAAALLGERLTALRVAGGALIIGAVVLLARSDLAREGAPAG
ncbi:MAG TPA: DMT family transporter [Anaeromyxobacteraceae bacterium]|nr:DMT family transporter [Anaeromyxobacteraceae bacterium]